MQDHHNHTRYGSALEHGEAHQKDHHHWSRRGFLRNLGILGGTSMLLGKLPVTAIGASPLSIALNGAEGDRILVLIRLKGGNDGLNTIIPLYDYRTYANARPDIRIRENDYTKLNDEFAIPNTLSRIHPLWEEGAMRVINSVGYPDQNLSHFRSTDIWSSGSDAAVIDNSGWLGRYLGDLYPNYLNNPPSVPPAIQIGGFGSSLFNDTNMVNISVNVSDPQQLEEIAERGQLYDLQNLPECLYGEQLGYMRTIANSTFFYAEVIAEAAEQGRNAVDYPTYNPLANSLATVARMIKGNLGTQIYMVTLDGFDTHARQAQYHSSLMNYLAEAVDLFYTDLAAGGYADKVLSMTFSEFGRRVLQNASQGTDHGAAAPLLLFGNGLNGSQIQGVKPNLDDMDQAGNLKFHTNFRQIYATILEQWLCIDSTTVNQTLGQDFERLNLGFACENVTTSLQNKVYEPFGLTHGVYAVAPDAFLIKFQLPQTAKIQVDVVSSIGQPIASLVNQTLAAGKHQTTFNISNSRLPNGQYFYRIIVDGRLVSGSLQVLR